MARDVPSVIDESTVTQRLGSELPEWTLKDGWIRREYKTTNWQHTMMVVNAIGYIAEAAFHHPDLTVTWAQVNVKLMTHAAKGITENDFELAKLIEQQVMWRPSEAQSLDGYEAGMKKKWTR